MKSGIKIGVLLLVLASLVVLVVAYPSLLVLAVLAGFCVAGWNIWNNLGSPPQNTKAKDDDFSDPYDSLEDDIRHHDYGYPGFGADDEDERHR